MSENFDITLVGLGASSLQFAWGIKDLPYFRNKKILFIDPQPDFQKSWCFWHSGTHPCDYFVTHQWDRLKFSFKDFSKEEQIASYQYRYIPASAMFDWFFSEGLTRHPNWHYLKDKVISHNQDEYTQTVQTTGDEIHTSIVLDARLEKHQFLSPHLWQHFRGWFVEFDEPILDSSTATLMDFSLTSDAVWPTFFYVLPFSSTSCLIEATVFSSEVWPTHQYDTLIKEYISTQINNTSYSVKQIETGKIPMLFLKNEANYSSRYFKIGGAAGMIKPSTGYTFNRITAHNLSLINSIQEGSMPIWEVKERFKFYDEMLLRIISQNPEVVSKIFFNLFKGNTFHQILSFMDESTSLQQDMYLLSKLPYLPFLKSFFGWWLSGSK